MEHLLDGDESQNNGNWQWAASVGADPQPYFRVFNPVRQQQKFDPDGVYVRRWVPELRALPDRWLAQPWAAPEEVQEQAGCVVGRDYPSRSSTSTSRGPRRSSASRRSAMAERLPEPARTVFHRIDICAPGKSLAYSQ